MNALSISLMFGLNEFSVQIVNGNKRFCITVKFYIKHPYGTGHGFTFQISSAYSLMLRSLLNLPMEAAETMDL